MADEKRNAWDAKLKRTSTSVLPVSKRRKGKCINVREFIKTGVDGKIYCAIYPICPLNCREYPRTESEFVTADTRGHYFEQVEMSSAWADLVN